MKLSSTSGQACKKMHQFESWNIEIAFSSHYPHWSMIIKPSGDIDHRANESLDLTTIDRMIDSGCNLKLSDSGRYNRLFVTDLYMSYRRSLSLIIFHSSYIIIIIGDWTVLRNLVVLIAFAVHIFMHMTWFGIDIESTTTSLLLLFLRRLHCDSWWWPTLKQYNSIQLNRNGINVYTIAWTLILAEAADTPTRTE